MDLKRKTHIVKVSCQALGPWQTARAVLCQMLSYNPEKDTAFDRRFRTDTASIVRSEDLGISDAATQKGAAYYISAPVRFERYLLRTLPIDHKDYDFVDIGCGKGRVLMLATELPFRSVAGVEISAQLCEIARRNLAVFSSPTQKCKSFEVHCLDARQLPPSKHNTVYHFYHPFHADILEPVLERIRADFQQTRRKLLIAYIWVEVRSLFPLFDRLGFKRLRYEQTANPRCQYAWFSL